MPAASGSGGLGRMLARGPSPQFVRFVLAGLVNTGFGYAAFLVALALCPTTFSALVASTIVAILFNFVSQGLYVFRNLRIRFLWRFLLTYALVFLFNALGLAALEGAGIRPQIGGLLLLPVAVLISYGLNSRFAFGSAR
ncbi:GtrA family protein [Enterovirga aerilata]|uniref:GtrA family protein n=1 Tax=Enterovirga aerilata TaxID=2730920 RepID=A0A849IE85_9HYPH|nr:GtrA family protein [Enterovirga sp. DB1703]NNM74535.1 GtrA family protein [Enterovirga sp. DB1703]